MKEIISSLVTVRSFRFGHSSHSTRSWKNHGYSFVRLGLLVRLRTSFCPVNVIRNLSLLLSVRIPSLATYGGIVSRIIFNSVQLLVICLSKYVLINNSSYRLQKFLPHSIEFYPKNALSMSPHVKLFTGKCKAP